MKGDGNMNRLVIPLAMLLILTAVIGCRNGPPESLVGVMIEPGFEIDHPLYYWETIEGATALYLIERYTSNITCPLHGLEGVRDIKTSSTSLYILHDDAAGNLAITRLEKDHMMKTEVSLEVEIAAAHDAPWTVTSDDVLAVCGVDDASNYKVVVLQFTCTEPESTYYDPDPDPVIAWNEQEWISTKNEIGGISIAPDGSMLALALPLEGGSADDGLYVVTGPGESPEPVSDLPLLELGDFSPDGSMLAATFEIEERVDLYLIYSSTLEMERITVSTRFYNTAHPEWHPGGQYLYYTTDFTTSYTLGANPLSGEQLYLYSLVSRSHRRLTAFDGYSMWIDFAPNGDFLLYSSTRGVLSRRGGRTLVLPDQSIAGGSGEEMEIETWRLFYTPWVAEAFMSGNPDAMTPDQSHFLVSWTIGGEDQIGFVWGPGVWIPPEERE